MKHQGGTEASPGSVLWHRGYHYATGSNLLLKTSLPGDDVEDPDTYSATAYDVNDRGALVEMPHLAGITRQFDDQMRGVDLGSGDDAVYHYDAAGQRVRKVVRTGATTKERLYVGAWERFQRSTTTLQEERETLHVMDDQRRIVMIETLTVDSGTAVSTPVPRQRFQLGNHLESAALEVDEDGALISYEEFHPYGTTSWWASNGSTDVSAKRYRYTGKEKDEETGLGRHGVRSYAPWLARWERPDPGGMVDGPNRFVYCRGNPVGGRDPTGNGTVEDEVLRVVDRSEIPLDQVGPEDWSDGPSFTSGSDYDRWLLHNSPPLEKPVLPSLVDPVDDLNRGPREDWSRRADEAWRESESAVAQAGFSEYVAGLFVTDAHAARVFTYDLMQQGTSPEVRTIARHTLDALSAFEANPSLILDRLSDPQKDLLARRPSMAPMLLGTALQKETNLRLRAAGVDLFLTGGSAPTDYIAPSVDLTSESRRAVDRHVERPEIEYLITYRAEPWLRPQVVNLAITRQAIMARPVVP